MLSAEGGNSRGRPRAKTQFRMSRERPGQRAAGLGRGEPQPWTLCEIVREQLSRYCKAKQAEIPTIRNFERFRRVDDRKISWTAYLLVAALRVVTDAIELKIDKIHVAHASSDVRAQPQNRVLCRFHTGNLD